jgi:hypothetical protein
MSSDASCSSEEFYGELQRRTHDQNLKSLYGCMFEKASIERKFKKSMKKAKLGRHATQMKWILDRWVY